MTSSVRVGVIGLGRRWRTRYLPALTALGRRFQVQAVHDPLPARSAAQASRLGCVASGMTEMLERDDVDALLYLEPAWFGFWPVEAACRLRKPILCAADPQVDPVGVGAACDLAEAQGVAVQLALGHRGLPAFLRLQELLAGPLGPPRLVLAEVVRPGAAMQPPRLPLAALDACAALFGTDPTATRAESAAGIANTILDFPTGAARLTAWRAPLARPALRLRVVAANGSATLAFPGRLRWTDNAGRHRHDFPHRIPVGQRLLAHFHQVVVAGRTPEPDLRHVRRLLDWTMLSPPASV